VLSGDGFECPDPWEHTTSFKVVNEFNQESTDFIQIGKEYKIRVLAEDKTGDFFDPSASVAVGIQDLAGSWLVPPETLRVGSGCTCLDTWFDVRFGTTNCIKVECNTQNAFTRPSLPSTVQIAVSAFAGNR